MFDYLVIGKGLIGSAAARYLSRTGRRTAVIGPDEPTDWPTHRGVFASHYDQGRITRILDADPIWALLAKRSIEQYRAIEQTSGIGFYHITGGLQVNDNAAHLSRLEQVGRDLGATFQTYDHRGLAQAYPPLSFPAGFRGVLESNVAGYINPRSLIAAQLKVGGQHGLAIIRDRALSVKAESGGVTVTSGRAETLRAKKVLIAVGAYTNQLLARPLVLTLKARTILLAELPPAEVERLRAMPTLIYRVKGYDHVDSIYMLPPIKYPDGNYYLKIGGGNAPVITLDSYQELTPWFHSGGSWEEAEALQEVLRSLIPQLKARSFHHKPCVTTYTRHNHPYVDAVVPGQLFVAAGGCGASAKSSNEIGRLAAGLVEHKGWASEEFRAQDFAVK